MASFVAVVAARLASWTSTWMLSPAVPSSFAVTTSVSRPFPPLRSASFRLDRSAVPTRTNQQSLPPFSKNPRTDEVT